MQLTRRLCIAAAATLLAAGCATSPFSSGSNLPPIVFVHGNGDNAGMWQALAWRFESNGWPADRLHALELPYPLARDDDTRAQAGRSSSSDFMALLKADVEKVLRATGASQVVLIGVSRGGLAIRNYIQNGGGAATVSHAILGGTPNHGVWAVPLPPYPDNSEFAGHGAFLTALNAPKNAAGDEVTGPVRWLTIRSDNNDKFAQPDGLWIGKRGVATGVTAAGPELKGATNLVIPRIDHRETALSREAFDAMFRFITGNAPDTLDPLPETQVVLNGRLIGLGLSPLDPSGGNFVNNLALTGARLEVFAIDPVTGERRGAPVHTKVIGPDGMWGPMQAEPTTRYEFVISAPGYATTHIYRSPFPRSSNIVTLGPERVPDADRNAPSLAIMTRPRGYLDPGKDKMAFDGQSPPPGAVLGAGVASSRVKPTGLPRTIVAEFNGEKIVGRTWPLSENRVSVLELTY